MVKITEGWITVQDGTKLYTKTWEVSQFRIVIIHMSITHQTARYLLLPLVSLLAKYISSWKFISPMHCSDTVFTAGYETDGEVDLSPRFQ